MLLYLGQRTRISVSRPKGLTPLGVVDVTIGKANSAARKARQASHDGASNHFLKSCG
jgi:hypothetical protein